MSNTTTNLSAQLNAPFPYEAYGVNYEGQAYVPIQWIVDRLNEVVGPLNWRHEFFDVNENMGDFSVELLGRLSIWDEGKNMWMDRVNYGNDTMTVLKEKQTPTAQDRMDCKKSAVSDSLKKCAAWFGVASDVFKGFIDVIKPKKNNGDDNPLYNRLVQSFAFIDRFNSHKNGIPILPESYREYYKEKGWKGVFQSDLSFSGSRSGTDSTPTGQDQTGSDTTQPSLLPGSSSEGGDGGSGNGSGTRTGGRSGSSGRGSRNGPAADNKPVNLRMKVLDAPKFNQDGSATFRAKMENHKEVTVFAGKDLAEEVKKLRPDLIFKSNGWYKEEQQKVTLATRGGKIEVEAA